MHPDPGVYADKIDQVIVWHDSARDISVESAVEANTRTDVDLAYLLKVHSTIDCARYAGSYL